jgi:GNAT superfamily N-acetyltransferase
LKELITLRQLSNMDEVRLLDLEYSKYYPWYIKSDYHEKCLMENRNGSRVTILAYYDNELSGCCHLLYNSKYTFFANEQIPEINDLNVLPQFRRKKVASKLFDELEHIAARASGFVGLGVGLYKDYGNAQRMYCKRGYILDGRGITYRNLEVKPGATVSVDDDLLLYLVKELMVK